MASSSFTFNQSLDSSAGTYSLNTFASGSEAIFTVTYEDTTNVITSISGPYSVTTADNGNTSASIIPTLNVGGTSMVSFATPGDDSTASIDNVSLDIYSAYGMALGFDPACFTRNTLISTPTGSTPVQDLHIGDLILNHVGQPVPVKWIGRQRFHPAFIKDGLPVCIRQGALGNGLPLRDLYVSPGHAIYIDHCLLIDAKALINGTTITQVTQWEGDVEYFHIETEHHEMILAEGALAETFMDNVSRTCFNNYSEYESLYPQASEMIELDIPRVSHKRQLPNAVKAKLEAIAEGLMGEGYGAKERMVG
jgi:hypothetical protein